MPTPVTSSQPAPIPSSLLGGSVGAWNRFWFSPMDPTTICFIRLLCAASAFYVCLTYSWGLLSYVGPNGWVDARMNAHRLHDWEFYAPAVEWSTRPLVPSTCAS